MSDKILLNRLSGENYLNTSTPSAIDTQRLMNEFPNQLATHSTNQLLI
jgi:hypothetical protein